MKPTHLLKPDEEKAALLGMTEEARSSCSSITLADENETASSERKTRFLMLSVAVHLVLALVSVGSLVVTLGFRDESCIHGARDIIYTPARDAVTYESRFMNNTLEEQNPFKGGNPTDEQTQAWRDLLSWQLLTLSEEDMRQLGKLNENSVKLEDGSGYLGQLDMYHQLHCLNYIREYIHRDYYDAIETPEMQVIHLDHCIDALRQIIICHADTSIVTYDWKQGHKIPYPNFVMERECRNWDEIFDFVQANQPNMSAGKLVNPHHGPVEVVRQHHELDGASSYRLF